jgi:large subunit ribosomal protein L24
MQKLRKGDKVRVMLGKDNGKEGTIEKLMAKEGMVFVTGVNIYKRHVRKELTQNGEGGMIDIIKPINISNASLVCPSCKKVTRVGFETLKDGSKVRICRKCKKQI